MSDGLTAAEIATLVGGALVGDGAARLTAVAPLDRAGPGDLSFLAAGRYLPYFHASRAGAVLLTEEHRGAAPGPATRIVVGDPHRAVLAVVRAIYPPPARTPSVHPTAIIGAGAVLGRDVSIGPRVVIGAAARLGDRVELMAGAVVGDRVSLGDDVVLYPNVVCYPGTVVGARVILHAGVVLGSDGFGYVPGRAGHEKIPHVGRCVIGDDVEIGANTTVDRGSVDDTVVGPGTKIDNLVQIGHNVRIGARCLIMAQVGIAGSTHVEDDVILAGQVGLAGHFTVGKGARIAAQSGVMGGVPAGATVFGYPARDRREALKAIAAGYRLAGIVDDLEELVKRGKSGQG
ncbi:MAG TPA: UDP-3-O-(3-hydroxymyristoyl)glucosamine N-acyltransferase [Gemmatimonadales bacterium]|nr:UDP-3-O-(3-hydroxymyristoyl)glucosamine N-acyltransferase [Gemmatimonadales bacterium]